MNMSMVEPGNCWDGIAANGVEGDEDFENILSILDFPMESLEGDGYVGDWDGSKSQFLGPIPSNVLMDPPMLPHPKIDAGPPHLLPGSIALFDATSEQKQIPVDIKGLASSRITLQNKFIEVQEPSIFQTQSPVSVLESSGSCSAAKTLPTKPNATVPVRTRSKRARPMGPNPWLLLSPSFFASACKKTSTARKTKEKRNKIVQDSAHASLDYSDLQNGSSNRPVVTKKCTHCEVTKTPQWREGPLGPKTLCNACGVRYRSGRLFPEYRPAASPTFVPSLHSNSHKKVIEMRNKGKQQVVKTEVPPESPQLEFISMSSYLFDLM